MTRQKIIYKYAEEFLDSLDFVDYVIYRLSYSKEDRKILFDLKKDRTFTAEEYEEISSDVHEEFCKIVKKEY